MFHIVYNKSPEKIFKFVLNETFHIFPKVFLHRKNVPAYIILCLLFHAIYAPTPRTCTAKVLNKQHVVHMRFAQKVCQL